MSEVRRSRVARFKPLLLEVAGALADEQCADVTQRLRQYRNRYAPILRLIATLVTPAVEESQLFGVGEGVGDAEGADASGVDARAKRRRNVSLIGAPRSAVMVNKRITVVHRLHEGGEVPAAEKLEKFMAYHFLPLALMHNRYPDVSLSDVPFVLRHYVHEATRTASFLVADPFYKTGVIIDPQADVSCYEADLAFLEVRLIAVVVTHCFVDIAMGHAALLERHPGAELLSGTPWDPVKCVSENGPSVQLGTRLQLRCVPVPSFSPECLVVELHLDTSMLGLFTGTALSTDAVPRDEFFAEFPVPHVPSEMDQQPPPLLAAEAAQRFLKERIWEKYFFPDASTEYEQPLDYVVVFPSHGGYSNVTHQLDLYWAAHIGDLKRMKHSRTVMDKVLDAESYIQHVRGRPSLPKPPLMSHVREWNLLSVPSAFGDSGGSLRARRSCGCPRETGATDSIRPVVVDIRGAAEHVAMHLKGSVNVPMTFPAAAYGVKKAELWLQCILLPLQPVVVICAEKWQCSQVHQRLALISPGAPVETFTISELQVPCEALAGVSAAAEGCRRVESVPLPPAVESKYLPRQLTWVFDLGAVAHSRLDCYRKLRLIEPNDGLLTLDCRTPYEFQNGSHNHSVFLSLGDLCQMTSLDFLELQSSPSAGGCCNIGPSPELARVMLQRLYEAALASGIKCLPLCRGVRKIVVYCATGYRSLIAASLLRRAFETAAVDISVCDVAGGALQIMQQRPDLWTVKNRSIICIS
uniref:Rhodanese domain-containing protein n=1 Tax=Trypanosoma congolense (strain IL3000) TaxID=1068625 RepID=F9WD68_TRYCI|nr:hypothetical protein, conserved [Trypanosoma congolense IL3000]